MKVEMNHGEITWILQGQKKKNLYNGAGSVYPGWEGALNDRSCSK